MRFQPYDPDRRQRQRERDRIIEKQMELEDSVERMGSKRYQGLFVPGKNFWTRGRAVHLLVIAALIILLITSLPVNWQTVFTPLFD